MIQFLPIQVQSTFDWSLVFAIVAGIAFFFGKLINEVSPYKENKYSIYVSGAIFVVLFVIFPPLVLYTIFESKLITLPLWWAIGIQFIVTWYLGKRLNVFLKIQRMKLDNVTSDLVIKKTQLIINKNKLLKKYNSAEQSKWAFEIFYFKKISHWLLFLFALINYWLTSSVIVIGAKPIYLFLSLLFLLISISCLAVLYAWNDTKYPQVTVHMDDGEKLKGELTKIDEGFINIIGNNKVYNIIDRKVKYIEVEILTKESKKTIVDTIFKKK